MGIFRRRFHQRRIASHGELNLRVAGLVNTATGIFVQFQCLPKPRQPLLAFRLAQISELTARNCAGKNQTIFSPGGRNVKHAHALEFFAPAQALPQFIEQGAAHRLATPIGNSNGKAFVAIQNVPGLTRFLFAMQIGNDHHGKLQTLRLMNRHQAHHIRRLVHLPFAFAPAGGFELLDITDKIANQVAGLFKLFGQAKQLFDVGDPLRAVKVRCDHGQEF